MYFQPLEAIQLAALAEFLFFPLKNHPRFNTIRLRNPASGRSVAHTDKASVPRIFTKWDHGHVGGGISTYWHALKTIGVLGLELEYQPTKPRNIATYQQRLTASFPAESFNDLNDLFGSLDSSDMSFVGSNHWTK